MAETEQRYVLCFLSVKWSKPEASACSWQPAVLRLLTAKWVLSLVFDIVWLFPVLSSLYFCNPTHVYRHHSREDLRQNECTLAPTYCTPPPGPKGTQSRSRIHTGDARSHDSQSRRDSMCRHSNTCPDGNWGQSKETTGWFSSCTRGSRSFPDMPFTAHYQME